MERSPLFEANSSSANLETPHTVQNTTVHCYAHISLTLVSLLAILNHSILSHTFPVRSILVSSSQTCLGLPSDPLSSHFPTKTLPTNVFFHTPDIRPPHSSPPFVYADSTW